MVGHFQLWVFQSLGKGYWDLYIVFCLFVIWAYFCYTSFLETFLKMVGQLYPIAALIFVSCVHSVDSLGVSMLAIACMHLMLVCLSNLMVVKFVSTELGFVVMFLQGAKATIASTPSKSHPAPPEPSPEKAGNEQLSAPSQQQPVFVQSCSIHKLCLDPSLKTGYRVAAPFEVKRKANLCQHIVTLLLRIITWYNVFLHDPMWNWIFSIFFKWLLIIHNNYLLLSSLVKEIAR